jgi:hypothetical protein
MDASASPPKAEGGDRVEIVGRRELGPSRGAHREGELVPRAMPAAVVGHSERRMPPPSTSTSICVRARVERILEQLLQRRRQGARRPRPGDLIDEVVGQR